MDIRTPHGLKLTVDANKLAIVCERVPIQKFFAIIECNAMLDSFIWSVFSVIFIRLKFPFWYLFGFAFVFRILGRTISSTLFVFRIGVLRWVLYPFTMGLFSILLLPLPAIQALIINDITLCFGAYVALVAYYIVVFLIVTPIRAWQYRNGIVSHISQDDAFSDKLLDYFENKLYRKQRKNNQNI